MILKKYEKEINSLIELLNYLPGFEYDSINAYGSAVNYEMFVDGVSDIDLIVMSKNFAQFNKKEIINKLSCLNVDFKEKRPIYIKDNLCERIEFYIGYERINIDVTLTSGLIPPKESLESDAWYDGFEALMGGVYIYSKSIYGQIPDYEKFLTEYYPFYNEELRNKRLEVLSNRLITYNERIRRYVETDSKELIDHLFKAKKFFIKFLYIYNSTYYWTPEKHTFYQLTQFLNLPEEQKRILCFMDGNIKEAAVKYLELTDNYINEYKCDKVKRLEKKHG